MLTPIKIDEAQSRQFATMSFVAAALIVALHTLAADGSCAILQWINRFFGNGLCSVAIPWFFFAAGFFLAGHVGESGWWGKEVGKRVRTLLVPFWFWSAVAYVFYVGLAVLVRWFGYDFHGTNYLDWVSLKGVLMAAGLYPFNEMPTMWFMRTLFLFVVFSPMIVRSGRVGLILLFALYILRAILPSYNREIWNLTGDLLSVRGAAYFAAGLYFRARPIRLPCRWTVNLVGVALLIARTCVLSAALGKLIEIAMIPFVMMLLFDVCGLIRLPSSLTALSFPVYVVHMMVAFVVTGVYGVTGIARSDHTGAALGWLKFFLVFGLSIALSTAILRLAPRLGGFVLGGRGRPRH